MIDLEISKALALAIGWRESLITIDDLAGYDAVWCFTGAQWQEFDYRDWTIAGPVAEWLGCFPVMRNGQWALWLTNKDYVEADTPQLAIALAAMREARK